MVWISEKQSQNWKDANTRSFNSALSLGAFPSYAALHHKFTTLSLSLSLALTPSSSKAMASLARGAASLSRISVSASKTPIQLIHRRSLAGAAGYFPLLYLFTFPIPFSISSKSLKSESPHSFFYFKLPKSWRFSLIPVYALEVIEIGSAEFFVFAFYWVLSDFYENLGIAGSIAFSKALLGECSLIGRTGFSVEKSEILKLQFYFVLKY